MAAALALHGFAGAASESPLEGVAEAPTKSGITLRAGSGFVRVPEGNDYKGGGGA